MGVLICSNSVKIIAPRLAWVGGGGRGGRGENLISYKSIKTIALWLARGGEGLMSQKGGKSVHPFTEHKRQM